jgi:ABC-type bacteriocin/lantibiotic exporter with double-glycine peptidase domain
VVNVVSFLIGGTLFFRGLLSIGNIYVLYKYIEMLKSPMEEFQRYMQQTIDLKGALLHLSSLMKFKSKMVEGDKIINSNEVNIEVDGLDFAYDDINVLQDIKLSFRAHEKVGIFGGSGSGKSTLCKIISKQLGIKDGIVFINGIDINQISVSAIRDKIGYITADACVFDGNIMDNLLIYNHTLDSNSIKAMYEEGYLSEFFSAFRGKSWENIMEMNLDETLSMGEKQLFVLFRLFFKPKTFYIFDEATSVIEEEVENRFYTLLEKLTHNAGIILVTHNVERLKKCDHIIVMKDGRVNEQGDTDALLNNKKSVFSQYLKQEWAMIDE